MRWSGVAAVTLVLAVGASVATIRSDADAGSPAPPPAAPSAAPATDAATATDTAPPAAAPRAASLLAVAPDSRKLGYQGRWDLTRSAATTVNSGSVVSLRYTGTDVYARFDTADLDVVPTIYVYVDGDQTAAVPVDRDRIRLTPPGIARDVHRVTLVVKAVDALHDRWKRPLASAVELRGFDVGGRAVVHHAVAVPDLKLSFLGDSITQGVHIGCTNAMCADATRDYAWLTATAFGAGLEQVGFSAQGVTRPGSGDVPKALGSLDYNFARSRASQWDADVVVVNQGQNDRRAAPDDLQAAYVTYFQAVLARYPHATVIALEPFGYDGETPPAGHPLELAVAEVDDPRLLFQSTRGWLGPRDFTDHVHPNARGHRRAATRLVTVISDDTGLQARQG